MKQSGGQIITISRVSRSQYSSLFPSPPLSLSLGPSSQNWVISGVVADNCEYGLASIVFQDGHFIRENMLEPTQIVMSMYDPAFASHGRTE